MPHHQSKIKINFIYPNGDHIMINTFPAQSIYDIANNNGIEMDRMYPKTCLVTLNENKTYINATEYIINKKDANLQIYLKLIRVRYIDRDTQMQTFYTFDGENMNDLIDRDDKDRMDLPFSCGGNLSCSTCHCIVDSRYKDSISEISEDEDDYLQYVQGCKDSRMGCQINFTNKSDNILIYHPKVKGL
jgi:ferredoxin